MDIGGYRVVEGSSKDDRRMNAGLILIDEAREKQGIISEPDGSETANPEITQGFGGWPPTGVLRECRLG
jgi:hypothetical protein